MTTHALDALKTLTPARLRAKWAELGVPGDPPRFKQGLLRALAWHMQGGELDAPTRRRLHEAIKASTKPNSSKSRSKKQRAHQTLQPGTVLIRRWRNHTHEVTVIEEKRFDYLGTEYASLSEIAREITGTRWSGPRFFGLTSKREAA